MADHEEPDRADPIINISGEKVALGPLCSELVPIYQKWNNDFVINRATRSARPVTFEEQQAAYIRYSQDPNYVFFTIYERPTHRPIGMTYLADIHEGNAEFGIVIGEADCHNRGYGTEASRLVLDYAFTVLGLHNVMLTVPEFNPAAIRAYQKAGFREIGRRRAARWFSGKHWDVVYMDCLASEFQSPLLGDIFTPGPTHVK